MWKKVMYKDKYYKPIKDDSEKYHVQISVILFKIQVSTGTVSLQ